jgi:hypothetical protein
MLRRVAHVTPIVSEKSRIFHSHIVLLHSLRRLLVIANVVPSSPILVTLMMEEVRSSETSGLTRATMRNISEDGILHSHRLEILKSYIYIYIYIYILVFFYVHIS